MEIPSSSRNSMNVNDLNNKINFPISIYKRNNNTAPRNKNEKTINEINKEKIPKKYSKYFKLIIITFICVSIITITVVLIKCLPSKKSKHSPEQYNNENYENQDNNNIFNKEIFTKNYKNLGHVNHLYFENIGITERNIPIIKNESLSTKYPLYGTPLTNTEHLQLNESIYNENLNLISSSITYDEMDEDGNLLLNNIETGKKLYKHTASIGNYYGDVSDNEKGIIKKITINPISYGNYITGLYAPPGEIIKYEITEDDFEQIGNSISFIIGQCTQSNGYSIHKNSMNYVRMPILINQFTYNKRIGYIGSFLGGPIYIQNPRKKNKFSIIIYNAVPYKHLIYGITTKEEFNSMDNYSAPYFDIEIMDKSLRFSGPKEQIKLLSYDNLVKVLFFWDKVHRTSKNIPHGASDYIGIHFIFDIHIAASGAAALAYVGGNWCQLPPSWATMGLDYEYITKYGAWGFIHELNHHYQRYGFFSSVQNEVTNNVISLVEYSLFTQISSNRNEFSINALTKSSGNHKFLDPEYSLSLINQIEGTVENQIQLYDVLIHMFGYELFINATKYTNGKGGIDIYYESLSETMEYDFTYYFENILGFTINNDLKLLYSSKNNPVFLPIASIYQSGRYYYKNNIEYFSNSSMPYKITGTDIPYILDFEKHLIVPNHFSYEIISITNPENGTLTKISDLKYSYTKPIDNSNSGIFNITVKLLNNNNDLTEQIYKLGINLEVDTTYSVQIIYTYETNIYSSIEQAYENNFEGYKSVNAIPNFLGSVTGVSNGNIIIWEGKFMIEDEGYKYILYKGGRGSSFLMASFNNKDDYIKIGYITINQDNFQFDAYAHYQKNLNKGDIIYFKLYLLATSNQAKLYIGISKSNIVNEIKVLSSQIYNLNYKFGKTYEFHSGDFYPRFYYYDSSFFINYNLFEISSPDFESWDNSDAFGLDKIFDGLTNTYMHTKKDVTINSINPLTLIINFNQIVKFNQIILKTYSTNNYLPKSFTLSISNDNIEWIDIETYNDLELNSSKTLTFNFDYIISSKYIKFYIFKSSYQYISIGSIEFNQPNLYFYELNPDEINYFGDVIINKINFPSYGVSYILNKDAYMKFDIICSEFRIKICNSFYSKVNIYINNNLNYTFIIEDNDEGYVIIIDNLEKKKNSILVYIKEGKLDVDSVIYN